MLEYLFFIFPQSWHTFIVSAKKKRKETQRKQKNEF